MCICVVGIDGRWFWKVKDWDGRVVFRGKKSKKSPRAAERAAQRRMDRG